MTPLFAPKPPPQGAAFGPGFGERRRSQDFGWSQGPAPYGPDAWGYQVQPQPKPAPEWPVHGPYGQGLPGSHGPYGVYPGAGGFGRDFGGFDPWSQLERMRGGQGWPQGFGRMVR